jgi:simple sugar transport system ATP-binding protein
MTVPALQATGISKAFGSLRALDDVNLTVAPSTFHAIIGENGAGKSTLAKCLLGFQPADSGEVTLDGVPVRETAKSRQVGMGMVFQHFTLAPSLTVAENLMLARPDLPMFLNWATERRRLERFLVRAPFTVDLSARVEHLAAGQKQKVEILKQLYLETRILILDEPTSVLTPAESDEIMGVLSAMVRSGELSVILITHKLRDVMAYASRVTVLRRGRCVATIFVGETDIPRLAGLMVGGVALAEPVQHSGSVDLRKGQGRALEIENLTVRGDHGLVAVDRVTIAVRPGEILGIAGVSGNGQRELVQAIGGQRPLEEGTIKVFDQPFFPFREAIEETGLFTLPEEPLENATVPSMTVAENLALRSFDRPPNARARFLLDRASMESGAADLIKRFSIQTPSPLVAIRSLSGGNVQRTVLARDLAGEAVRVMVVANTCFGLDFAATAFVHNRLVELRNRAGAVLLVSEDLDELAKLADRIVVISRGRIVHETSRADLNLEAVGGYMGGHAST